MLCSNIGINESGHLTFAGEDTVRLAAHYKTPLYLMDEDRIRENCRVYKAAMARAFGEGSFPLYASKAASFKRIYAIMQDEGMAIDVVSAGEIATAKRAGFQMERAFFHGNNKTDADISYAMAANVGYFVADHAQELEVISREAKSRGIRQKVLLRLTPGIDPHTYEAVATGKVDSKFGVAIETGQAEDFVRLALSLPNIRLMGYHCHVGSQVFDEDGSVYHDAAKIMLRFAADMKRKLGADLQMLDLGGGYGVRYTDADPAVDIVANIASLAEAIRSICCELELPVPAVLLEPGRSIVADAGMTLYTAGAGPRDAGALRASHRARADAEVTQTKNAPNLSVTAASGRFVSSTSFYISSAVRSSTVSRRTASVGLPPLSMTTGGRGMRL